jgi:hypothetical protein
MTASVVYAPAVALNLDFPVTVSFSLLGLGLSLAVAFLLGADMETVLFYGG